MHTKGSELTVRTAGRGSSPVAAPSVLYTDTWGLAAIVICLWCAVVGWFVG